MLGKLETAVINPVTVGDCGDGGSETSINIV